MATPVLELLHTAPEVLDDKVVVAPVHILLIPPDITDGTGLTVTTAVLEHPVAKVLVTAATDIPV